MYWAKYYLLLKLTLPILFFIFFIMTPENVVPVPRVQKMSRCSLSYWKMLISNEDPSKKRDSDSK